MSLWELDRAEREAYLFLRRACRTRGAIVVMWEELETDLAHGIALFCRQVESYEAWRKTRGEQELADPVPCQPLYTYEEGQIAFMEALRRLRDRGWIWEKVVFDCKGAHIQYKPLH